MTREFTSRSESETVLIAHEIARELSRGDVVALVGDLGTGKTQFVKGICEAFRVRGHVSSPTFVMLNRYEGLDREENELLLFHFDLYRVSSPAELYDLGYEEFLYDAGISVIEWADRLGELLPPRRYDVRFSFGSGENDRRIVVEALEGREVSRTQSPMQRGGT